MNSKQLKDKLKNISREKNINFNLLLRNYMYERFIERLAISDYKDNFILKGGYYLSILFGLDKRYSMDIDFNLKNKKLSKENIEMMISKVIAIDIHDDAKISLISISSIKDEDEYGGYRIKIMVKIDNIREVFSIDVATGDTITPREIVYKYQLLTDYKSINLKVYNLETVLAEKKEIILSRKEFSSRMKDYYDIYLITKLYKDIDLIKLRKAFDITFSNRNFDEDLTESFQIIRDNKILKERWKAYSKKYEFTKNITYSDIMESIDLLIKYYIQNSNCIFN